MPAARPLSFQDLILTLHDYWSRQGCVILQPYDVEVGAGTLNPATVLRALGPKPWRVAYVQPFQNPTARVMSLARRRDIVEVAARRGIVLVEDDLYGPTIADLGLPPLAQMAPDRVAYVSGLAKSLAPGLRTGFLIPPDGYRAACLDALRAVAFGPPTLGAAVGTHWIERG